jgi:hypothetical protein
MKMNNMKNIIKLSFLFSIIILAGCGSDLPDTYYFSADGTVYDETATVCIPGIQVIICENNVPFDTVYSDEAGYVYSSWKRNYRNYGAYSVYYKDIDGELNGAYKDTTVVPEFTAFLHEYDYILFS